MIVVSVPIALHSQSTFVLVFNGLNFSDWSEKVQFHLGILDLDLVIRIEKPAATTDIVAIRRKLIIGLGKSQIDSA